MASTFTILTNNQTSFESNTNPDVPVKTSTLNKDGECVVEHVRLDFGVTDDEQQVTKDNPLPVGPWITAIYDGRKTVATAGTREQLIASPTPCKKVDIVALESNKGVLVVGGSTCVAAAGTRRGIPLSANQSYSLEISDASLIYLDVTTGGEGVTYAYYT